MKSIYLFCLIFLVGCTHSLMKNNIYEKCSIERMNYLCHQEKIPPLNYQWVPTGVLDFETSDSIRQWIYIRDFDRHNETVYIINEIIPDSLFIFNKRVKFPKK